MNTGPTAPGKPNRPLPLGGRWAGWLAVSLSLNVLLLMFLAFDRSARKPPLVRPLEDAGQSPATVSVVAASIEAAATPPRAFEWPDVAVEDLREYASNLRRLGCPDHVVRGVLADELRHRYAPLIRELKRVNTQRYWDDAASAKSGRHRPRTPDEIAAEEQLRAVHNEYERWQRELGTGDDERHFRRDRFPEPDGDDVRVSFLSPEKQARLREQDDAIGQLYRRLRSESVPEEEVRLRVRELEAQQDLERAGFLDPIEYAEYERRTSRHAGLFGEWHGFEPTPEERATILDWRESISGEAPNEEEWEEGLRPLLGDTRFAELERARDPDYRELVELTAHFGMDESVANEVYAAQQAAQAAATTLRTMDTLGPGQQLEALAAIRLEAERALLEHLGEDGLEVYRRHANWLETLVVP